MLFANIKIKIVLANLLFVYLERLDMVLCLKKIGSYSLADNRDIDSVLSIPWWSLKNYAIKCRNQGIASIVAT